MACTGCNDGCLDSVTLAEGQQGLFGGFSALWRKNSGTSSSVSAGGLTFNNTNMVSATAIYVHKTNVDNSNHTNFLNSFSNGGSYGLIRIFQEDDSSVFWYGTLTAVALSGNVFTLTVTNIQSSLSSGTIPTGRDLVLSFTPKGATGSSSSAGLTLLHNSLTDTGTTAAASPQTLKTYTLPANTLSVNNDIIEVEAVLDGAADATSAKYGFSIYFGGVNAGEVSSVLLQGTGQRRTYHLSTKINRIGANSERIISAITEFNDNINGDLTGWVVGVPRGGNNDLVIDLTANQDITVRVSRTSGNFTSGQWTCRKLTVKHIKQ
jgi:hypothetical protein